MDKPNLETLYALERQRTAELTQIAEQLHKEINERTEAQKKLQIADDEKAVLLKEIHHRVKNNLQIIVSLLNMQSDLPQNKLARGALQDCYLRVQSMALIHHKLYESGDLSQVNFRSYIASLTTELFETYHVSASQVSIHMHVEDIALEIDQAIPLGLILNELMSNALKYAFPKGRIGQIGIDLRSISKDEWALSFNDNGIGFPKTTSSDQPVSLGLEIIDALSHQLKGRIEWHHEQGCGFTLKFNPKRQLENKRRLIHAI